MNPHVARPPKTAIIYCTERDSVTEEEEDNPAVSLFSGDTSPERVGRQWRDRGGGGENDKEKVTVTVS